MQYDRFKKRNVDINVVLNQNKGQFLPIKNHYSVTLLTTGKIEGNINKRNFNISAPAIICLNDKDNFHITKNQNAVLPTISFAPDFLSVLRISEKEYIKKDPQIIKERLKLFNRTQGYTGIYSLNSQLYSKVLNQFLVAISEIQIQTDNFWVCRIKKCLIESLTMVEQFNQEVGENALAAAVNYIHLNYSDQIEQKDLVNVAHLNRVSLNKLFQQTYGCTSMQFLQKYRLTMATELLTLTGLSLIEIAYAVGYNYDTFFIKQFEKHYHETPTQFRKKAQKIAQYQ